MDTGRPERLNALLRDARHRIDAAEAAVLLAHALGKPQGWLYAHADDPADEALQSRFESLLARRERGEPVAYITGRRGFWTLDLEVGDAVLIPRPETELLVELALARIPEAVPMRIADLGTGSGAIALALAHERPAAAVVATDASIAALGTARANAARLRLGNVEFRQGDWFAPLQGETFSLIASNPPYIATDDPHLAQGDLRFEPALALSSGSDGLDAIRVLCGAAQAHLHRGGWLLLEHGWEQGAAVRGLLQAAGFVEVATCCDLERRDRVTLGRRPL